MCFFPVLPAKSIQLENTPSNLSHRTSTAKWLSPMFPHRFETPTFVGTGHGHPPPPEAVEDRQAPGCPRLQRHKIFSAKNAPTGAPKPQAHMKVRSHDHGKFASLFVGSFFFWGGGGGGVVQQKKHEKISVNQHGLSCWFGLLV